MVFVGRLAVGRPVSKCKCCAELTSKDSKWLPICPTAVVGTRIMHEHDVQHIALSGALVGSTIRPMRDPESGCRLSTEVHQLLQPVLCTADKQKQHTGLQSCRKE